MISLRRLWAPVCALALLPAAPPLAHDNPSAFEATQWRCLDIPQLVRYAAGPVQLIQIANTGATPINWWFFALDISGTQARALSHDLGVMLGRLGPYRQVSFTNQRLQRSTPRLTARDEQPLGLCVRNAHKGGKFIGFVTVRDIRRPSGPSWIGFHLTDWWDWWQVTKTPSATTSASTKSSAGDTLQPSR